MYSWVVSRGRSFDDTITFVLHASQHHVVQRDPRDRYLGPRAHPGSKAAGRAGNIAELACCDEIQIIHASRIPGVSFEIGTTWNEVEENWEDALSTVWPGSRVRRQIGKKW